jgi:hypothetical protein
LVAVESRKNQKKWLHYPSESKHKKLMNNIQNTILLPKTAISVHQPSQTGALVFLKDRFINATAAASYYLPTKL